MALVSVIILGFIFTILGLTLYSMAKYEFGQATRRDQSGSAFFLADAAIEHAKAEIFNDILWSAGFDSVASGEGYYSLAVTDSSFEGEPATHLYARGFVPLPGGGFVERDVEVFAERIAAALQCAIYSQNEIHTNGNVGVCGCVHGNVIIDAGGSSLEAPGDCAESGGLTDGFEVVPPVLRTHPDYYPNTTYYYVVGKKMAPFDEVLVVRPDPTGPLTMRDGVTTVRQVASIPAGAGGAIAQYMAGNVIDYQFDDTAEIAAMFDWTTGICLLDVGEGDTDVVVNFGEYLKDGPGYRSDLEFEDNNTYDSPVLSTIFNTRYTGADTMNVAALTDSANWTGGNNQLKQIELRPQNGIALGIHTIDMPGPAKIQVGTDEEPALVYVTGSITKLNANGYLYGTTIVLGDITSMNGNVDFYYDGGYVDQLPPYLLDSWDWSGISGALTVRVWREPVPLYTSL